MSNKRTISEVDCENAKNHSSKKPSVAVRDDDGEKVDIVRRMIPPDVFLHQIVGPFLTPKEVRLLVQRIWPMDAFDWKTHCCPKHPGTVFSYFPNPPQNETEQDEEDGNEEESDEEDDEDDEDNEDNDDDEEEQQELMDQENNESSGQKKHENSKSGVPPSAVPPHLVLRCKDCVFLEKLRLVRCDHCNVFKPRGDVNNRCNRCPQVFCNSCARESYDGVCGECTLCAFCRNDFGVFAALSNANDRCETCRDIFCSNCRDIQQIEQEQIKREFRASKFAEAAEKRRKQKTDERLLQQALLESSASQNNSKDGKSSASEETDTTGENTPCESATPATQEEPKLAEENEDDAEGAGQKDEAPKEEEDDDEADHQNDSATAPKGGNDGQENAVDGMNAGTSQETPTERSNDNQEAASSENHGANEVQAEEMSNEPASTDQGESESESDSEDENNEVNVDYEELNLPRLDKNPKGVQVCRSCHYCYCSSCSYQHQCSSCGHSFWL